MLLEQIAISEKSPARASSAACMSAIMRMIRDGVITPAERVGEASLAATLNVGLATIRDALKRLTDAGILVRVPRSGSFLRKFTLQDVAQIIDVRCALECLAARHAAQACSEQALDALREEAAEVDAIAVQSATWDFDRDRNFHLHVCQASNNAWLLPIMKNQYLLECCFLVGMQFHGVRKESSSIPSHVEIVDAIATRDADRAEDTIRRHILMHKEIRLRARLGEFVTRA